MRAELADGRVLEFPDGTDQSVIQNTVKKMIASTQSLDAEPSIASPAIEPQAQPVGAAQPVAPVKKSMGELVSEKMGAFNNLITGEDRMTPEMESMQSIGDAPELNEMSVPAFKASFGLLSTGKTSSLQGILKQQFGDNVQFREDSKGNAIVDFPSGSYALNKPGLSAQDLIRGAFDIAAFTPAGRGATALGVGMKSAATEAGIESLESSVGGEFSPEEVVMAGGFGAAAKGVEKLVGAIYRAFKGRVPDEVAQAARESGIPLMTSDVIPPQTFAGRMAQQTGEKIPLAGTGSLREAQQQLRERAVSNTIEKYGEFSYPAIINSLKTQKDKIKKAAGNVLESVGNKLDDVGEIPLTSTKEAIKQAREELGKPGVFKSTQALDDLDEVVRVLDEAPQSFTTLKENRTAFREIVAGADKAERTQLTSRAKSLLERVQKAMTDDMTNFAKSNLEPQDFAKWQKANKVYANEAVKLTKTRLKNVLDKGDVTPESVKNMLFSQNPSEVNLLYKSLGNEGKRNTRSAIISRVVNDLSRRQHGITPNSFASEMKKYGLQVDTFFKGEEKAQLQGLLKALNATRRAQDAAITTPTGQQVIGGGTALSLWVDPVSTVGAGGTLGGLARLYESAPVRNALLRLDSVPVGSTKFDQALTEFVEILQPAIQTMREQMQDTE